MKNNDERYEVLLEKLLDEIAIYSNPLLKKESEFENFTRKHNKKTGEVLYSANEALDDLRLCVKYLLFDLDAIRRENLCLAKLLEDKES